MSSHYDLLGVRRDASAEAVKKAYEKKLKALDRVPPEQRAVRERLLKEALAVLTDPVKRTDYDSRMEDSTAPTEGTSSLTPIVIGVVVVAITVGAIFIFMDARTKERTQMRIDKERAAEKLEKDKRERPSPSQPPKR